MGACQCETRQSTSPDQCPKCGLRATSEWVTYSFWGERKRVWSCRPCVQQWSVFEEEDDLA